MNVVPLTPITSVKILNNIPLDNTYKDTMDFSSVSSQLSYFTSKVKFAFNNLTPIKLQNMIRLPVPADKLYDCNYIMWQNANFGIKWFYGFIKAINYINVNMCEIEFEMDVLQSWMFDYALKPSYVVREHSNTDNVGDNLVSENVDIGYYREEPAEKTSFFDNYSVVVATAYDGDIVDGSIKAGIYTGLKYVSASTDDPAQITTLNNLLKTLTNANKIDAITSIFMLPTEFVSNDELPKMLRYQTAKRQTQIGTYEPKNKKLLTYPYNFLYAFTSDGANAIYRYEFFQDPTYCGFVIECAISCNPEIILEPIAYQKQQFNIDESLSMTNFPQCSYNIDSFRAWLAQNSVSSLINLTGSTVAMGAGLMTGGAGAVVGGMLGTASTVNGAVQASMKPPIIKGTQGNSTFTGTREKNFYFVNKHISEEYAKIIDDYFSMYGYATHRVKVPNVTGRPSWNYVQTDDCKLIGSIPFNDISKIKEVFNKGVTFWHGDYVGDYTRNNSI